MKNSTQLKALVRMGNGYRCGEGFAHAINSTEKT